jgi:hypothetical protein
MYGEHRRPLPTKIVQAYKLPEHGPGRGWHPEHYGMSLHCLVSLGARLLDGSYTCVSGERLGRRGRGHKAPAASQTVTAERRASRAMPRSPVAFALRGESLAREASNIRDKGEAAPGTLLVAARHGAACGVKLPETRPHVQTRRHRRRNERSRPAVPVGMPALR